MAEITAAAVKSLRERTGLPMMECKKALQETDGDEQAAVEWLRTHNIKIQETRLGRETSAGRLAVYTDLAAGVGAMIELKCESAPVAGSPEFIQFSKDIAKQLATGPGAKTADELLGQPAPGKPGMTIGQQKDDMFNRIREVFNLGRIVRFDAPCGGYVHHDGSMGALVEITGTDLSSKSAEAAKDVAMHIVAKSPQVVSKADVDPASIDKERQILTDAAKAEGKPEAIIAKMVEGRLKNFFAERVLLEQLFVKDDSKTVGQFVKEGGITVKRFVHWNLGKE